eukprot:CAMPEP_0183510142 /NCGR_PEP_ID=MMETSP0371-20130417/10114_1 /TAXON_ID=268820 /ORGANISM="Peridinium aciculiferum, Strain PAER-2" /LENGTH=129 /DNA_ID=CAMNT_0025706905 /DNA_START=24 /DNA_END=414 /DNA_ORIENTATION=+
MTNLLQPLALSRTSTLERSSALSKLADATEPALADAAEPDRQILPHGNAPGLGCLNGKPPHLGTFHAEFTIHHSASRTEPPRQKQQLPSPDALRRGKAPSAETPIMPLCLRRLRAASAAAEKFARQLAA